MKGAPSGFSASVLQRTGTSLDAVVCLPREDRNGAATFDYAREAVALEDRIGDQKGEFRYDLDWRLARVEVGRFPAGEA